MSALNPKLEGSIVALVTPMHGDLTIDWESLARLVEWHVDKGTHGLVAVGTSGESSTLDVDEHIELTRRMVEQVAGRIPVIAGTGANSTREAIALTREAKLVGADACLLVSPYYNKPTQEGLYQHHAAIAEAVDIPQILYNVPSRTAVDMQPETVARLATVDNIVGIKEATGSLERLKDIQACVPEDFLLFSGDDATALDFMLQGGHGEISVTANVVPDQTAKIYELIKGGRVEEARQMDAALMPLHSALFLESNPIPVKWAVSKLGLIGGSLRLPLTLLDEKYYQELMHAMSLANALIPD